MLLTSGILLAGSGLAGINSLIPCNDWPVAGGVSVGAGLLTTIILRWLKPPRMPVLPVTDAKREELKTYEAGDRLGIHNVTGMPINPTDTPGPGAKPDSVDDVRLER